MNIFVTDSCPVKSAQALDDLRLNKMILESVQMLSVALVKHGCPASELPKKVDGTPFKGKGWETHPCTVWVCKSKSNYMWLVDHTSALIEEMHRRRGTTHSMHRNMPGLIKNAFLMPDQGLTPFANCSMFKDNGDVIESYRKTMLHKWTNYKRQPKWTNASPPTWVYDLSGSSTLVDSVSLVESVTLVNRASLLTQL